MFSASLSALKPRLLQLPAPGMIVSNLFVVFALCLSIAVSLLAYVNVSGQAENARAGMIDRVCQTPQTIRVAVCPAAEQAPRSSHVTNVGRH
jgi:hypothetical protein